MVAPKIGAPTHESTARGASAATTPLQRDGERHESRAPLSFNRKAQPPALGKAQRRHIYATDTYLFSYFFTRAACCFDGRLRRQSRAREFIEFEHLELIQFVQFVQFVQFIRFIQFL